MIVPLTIDDEFRKRLVKAVLECEADPQARAPLNALIREIQQPYRDKLDAIREIVKV